MKSTYLTFILLIALSLLFSSCSIGQAPVCIDDNFCSIDEKVNGNCADCNSIKDAVVAVKTQAQQEYAQFEKVGTTALFEKISSKYASIKSKVKVDTSKTTPTVTDTQTQDIESDKTKGTVETVIVYADNGNVTSVSQNTDVTTQITPEKTVETSVEKTLNVTNTSVTTIVESITEYENLTYEKKTTSTVDVAKNTTSTVIEQTVTDESTNVETTLVTQVKTEDGVVVNSTATVEKTDLDTNNQTSVSVDFYNTDDYVKVVYTEPKAPVTYCFDSETSSDRYGYGSVTSVAGDSIAYYDDACDGSTVIEYYCVNNYVIAKEVLNCNWGCNNGACYAFPQAVEEPKPAKTTFSCTDSDGGAFPKTLGTVYANETDSYGNLVSISNPSDWCTGYLDVATPDKNALREYFCNADGTVDYQTISCPGGCANGACLVESKTEVNAIVNDTVASSCVDSDGGFDIYVAGLTDGRVNGLGSYFSDTCNDANGGAGCSGTSCKTVAEGYCKGGQVTNVVTTCPSYCANGACVNESAVVVNPQIVAPVEVVATSDSDYPVISMFTVTPSSVVSGTPITVSAQASMGASASLQQHRLYVVGSQGGKWSDLSSGSATASLDSVSIPTARNAASFYNGPGTYTLRYEVKNTAGLITSSDQTVVITDTPIYSTNPDMNALYTMLFSSYADSNPVAVEIIVADAPLLVDLPEISVSEEAQTVVSAVEEVSVAMTPEISAIEDITIPQVGDTYVPPLYNGDYTVYIDANTNQVVDEPTNRYVTQETDEYAIIDYNYVDVYVDSFVEMPQEWVEEQPVVLAPEDVYEFRKYSYSDYYDPYENNYQLN